MRGEQTGTQDRRVEEHIRFRTPDNVQQRRYLKSVLYGTLGRIRTVSDQRSEVEQSVIEVARELREKGYGYRSVVNTVIGALQRAGWPPGYHLLSIIKRQLSSLQTLVCQCATQRSGCVCVSNRLRSGFLDNTSHLDTEIHTSNSQTPTPTKQQQKRNNAKGKENRKIK